MTEVQMAKLGLQRSKNNEIRHYAQQMIQENTPVNQQLMQLANRKGISLPTTIGRKYQAAIASGTAFRAIARLSQFSGRDFDQAYKEAGINLHLEYTSRIY
jgi:putative membrane protein